MPADVIVGLEAEVAAGGAEVRMPSAAVVARSGCVEAVPVAACAGPLVGESAGGLPPGRHAASSSTSAATGIGHTDAHVRSS